MAAVVVEYLEQSASFERNVHHEDLELNSGSDSKLEAGDVLPSRYNGAQSAARWYKFKRSNEPNALLNPITGFY